ncbi:DUF2231 domain-containing protein [Pseudonocardia sp. CA-107938]|uniref:DUF2231 domain-containing protein n=1 Tax=Pseudonocardia sp. CA-107938 TaxID=3240021 RepID=UPI003D8ED186
MTFDGLPLHPLIVHVLVAFVPLSALGTIAMAVRTSWRRSFEVPVLLLAVLCLLAVPVVRSSGDELAEAVHHQSSALEAHMSRADTVLPAMIVYVMLLAAAFVIGRRTARGDTTVALTRASTIAVVLAAISGLVATALVIWTGHAGATATWSGTL